MIQVIVYSDLLYQLIWAQTSVGKKREKRISTSSNIDMEKTIRKSKFNIVIIFSPPLNKSDPHWTIAKKDSGTLVKGLKTLCYLRNLSNWPVTAKRSVVTSNVLKPFSRGILISEIKSIESSIGPTANLPTSSLAVSIT